MLEGGLELEDGVKVAKRLEEIAQLERERQDLQPPTITSPIFTDVPASRLRSTATELGKKEKEEVVRLIPV